jgi:hypothetical protein
MTLSYAMAWLLVVAAGASLAAALSPPRQPGRVMVSLGYGLVLGMLAAAAAAALTGRSDTAHAWLHAAPLLVAAAVAGTAVAAVRWYRAPAGMALLPAEVEYWKSMLLAAALASLVWRASIIGSEVLLRPTYPWDAWDAWAVKSKTWFLLGHFAPFVVIDDWLRSPAVDLYSGPGWAYPATLGWMQVWFASAAGEWIEPLVNLPWLALWLGLLLGHYGQWRALGLSRLRAGIAVYVLGSLPLLSTHVALAGYADLWIATLFGFALLAWLRWQERGERDQLLLSIICAAALPLVKLEGMVWCLALAAAFIVGLLPVRWRWRAIGAGSALVVLVVLVGQSQLLFAAIGWVRSGSRAVEIPVIGKLALAWHGDALIGVLRSLFTQANWNLLWWLVPAVLVWRWRTLRASETLRLCALLLMACFGLLLFLFVFTDAAEWAESYTAVNRLIMHITPGVVSLMVLLVREPAPTRSPTDTGEARVLRSDPV